MKVNKLAAFTLALAAMTGFSACSSGSSDDKWKDIDAIAVRESSDGNWSFYKPDGTLLYEDEFKSKPSAICNGYFAVEEGDGYTLYHAGSKPEVVGDLEDLKGVGYFSEEGLIPIVRPKERISIVNTKGETVFTLEPFKGKEIVSCEVSFTEGLLGVKNEDGLWGFVDAKGEMVIEPKYKGAKRFNGGRCAVSKDDEDGTIIFINKKGETLFTLRKGQEVENAYLGDKYTLVKDSNDHLIILDDAGETVLKCPSKVKTVYAMQGDKIIFKNEDGEFGLMNLKGETLIRPKYKVMQFMEGDDILAQSDDYSVVINSKGEESVRMEDYESVTWMGKFGFMAREGKYWVVLDKEGKTIKNAEFDTYYSQPYISIYVISSDYFDMDAVVNKVVGLVKDDGVGNYHFNAAPSQVFSNPGDYVNKSSAELTDLEINGNKYLISVNAYFTSYISRYNYSYYSSNRYEWGSGKLWSFLININTDAEWGIEGSQALLSAFERNGFKTMARTKKDNSTFAVLLEKGDVIIYIMGDKGEKFGNVGVLEKDDSSISTLKSQIEAIDNNVVDNSDDSVDEP